MVNASNSWLRKMLQQIMPPVSSEPAGQDPGAPRVVTILHPSPIGTTGTESYMGYNSEDYLQAMRGKERADVFDKMRRSDSQVGAIIRAIKSMILGAIWEVDPASVDEMPDRAAAEADAQLIRHILFKGMDESWDQKVQEFLTIIWAGHSIMEIIDRPVLNHPTLGSFNALRDLSWRSPRTIERWNLDRATGKLLSVTQISNGDLDRMVDIPADFLLVFSIDREGSNYEGISPLRSCYGNWLRKDRYMRLNAVGIEKFAVPTPTVTVPEGKESGTQFDNMVAALQKYMSHEKSYLTVPDGWKIEINNNAYDPAKVEASIDAEDKRMAKNFLASFLELGTNGFGSQSLSVDLSDFFLNSINYIANGIIAGQINAKLIPRQIILNRGERPAYPILKATGINDRLAKEAGDLIKSWVDGGLITADDVLEAHLRKRMGLPVMDQATARKKAAPALPGDEPTDPEGTDQEDEDPAEKPPRQSLMERIIRSRRSSRGAS